MTTDMHRQVAAVLEQAQRLQSVLDEQLYKMETEKFTAADESKSVEVTLNGHHWLTDVFIKAGLLRLGAKAVEQRLHEALLNATMRATESIEADRERLDAILVDITDELTDIGDN